MIHIAAVSYLNTKPFLYGLLQSPLAPQIELVLDVPAGCARRLQDGTAQIGLVPVAVIPHLPQARIISEYCIGAEGAVKTVCIYSHQPIDTLDRIYLDTESRTSVELTSVLLREYWKLHPQLLPDTRLTGPLAHREGILIIGDKAMGVEYPYCYDLAEVWQQHTGLPFVFAAWVTNGFEPDNRFTEQFNAALADGIGKIPSLMLLLPKPYGGFDMHDYYTRCISYHLDAPKKQALDRFLSAIAPEFSRVV